MSDEKLDELKQLDGAENTSKSSDSIILEESSSLASTSSLLPCISNEPTKRTLRQLICSIYAKMHPKESKLPSAELATHIRNGDVLLRRLRRLIASSRCYIDLEPMTPLQEAIAKELANKLGCETRFYNDVNDGRYMVAYRPGFKPNHHELFARRMCGSDITVKEEKDEEKELQVVPMSLHQPIEQPPNSTPESLALGLKILEKFQKEFILMLKQSKGNCNK